MELDFFINSSDDDIIEYFTNLSCHDIINFDKNIDKPLRLSTLLQSRDFCNLSRRRNIRAGVSMINDKKN